MSGERTPAHSGGQRPHSCGLFPWHLKEVAMFLHLTEKHTGKLLSDMGNSLFFPPYGLVLTTTGDSVGSPMSPAGCGEGCRARVITQLDRKEPNILAEPRPQRPNSCCHGNSCHRPWGCLCNILSQGCTAETSLVVQQLRLCLLDCLFL